MEELERRMDYLNHLKAPPMPETLNPTCDEVRFKLLSQDPGSTSVAKDSSMVKNVMSNKDNHNYNAQNNSHSMSNLVHIDD